MGKMPLLPARLRRIQDATGRTNIQMAEWAGLPKRTYQNYLLGVNEPPTMGRKTIDVIISAEEARLNLPPLQETQKPNSPCS